MADRAPKRRWESRCVPGWDSWSPGEISKMQDEMLRRFISEQVYPLHPHYRRVFDENRIDPGSIRAVSDLERIPFTYKEDIAPYPDDPDNPRRFVLTTPQAHAGRERLQELYEEYEPVVTMFTTGRTAEPTPFFFTLYDMARLREAGRRLASVISSRSPENSDRQAVTINNFPGSHHLAYWVALTGAEGTASTMVNTGGGSSMATERVLNVIERARPTVLMGLPGYTYDLMKKAASEGRDFSSMETVVMGGDRISAGAREKIAGLLEEMGAVDPVVTGAFGATEMKYAWGDCGGDESRGYHTYPDMEIVEVIDPDTGKVLPGGETGELVVTNLDSRGSVVLRYRTGDILVGGYSLERCPCCGRTMPRVSSEISRRVEAKEFALSKVKGNLVDLKAFAGILESNIDVLEWKVEIRKRNDDPDDVDEVYIYVCPTSVSEERGLVERITEDVRTSLEFTPDRIVVTDYDAVTGRFEVGAGARVDRVADYR